MINGTIFTVNFNAIEVTITYDDMFASIGAPAYLNKIVFLGKDVTSTFTEDECDEFVEKSWSKIRDMIQNGVDVVEYQHYLPIYA